MKGLSAAGIAIGLGILGVAASKAFFPQAQEAPTAAPVNVTQYHNNLSRDGLFIDSAFTPSAAANLARDVNFDGTIVGNVYAQPLYVEGGPDGRAKVIAVTESDNVYALDAITGAIIWQRNVGTPSSGMGLISIVGITGTPVIDLASRSLILVAVISGPNNMIYSLNVDTGATNPGFPLDVNASFPDFSSSLHMQRSALSLLGNMVYVPYGGYADQGNYHGRVLGVSLDGLQLGEWVTTSLKSGIWTPGGIASDGTNLFVATGNAPGGTTPWGGSEAIIRLQPGPVFSGSTTDFWAPTNWQSLDTSDIDLGGTNPIIVDVPGATPSALVVAIGKDHNGYLLDRANLGGIAAPLAQASVGSGQIINAPATYRTSQGTFVVLRPISGTLIAFKITPTSPPTIATGWTVSSTGRTSPFVTSTDGTSNPIVWAYGHGTNQRLFGYNGETGAVIFAGGGANDTISGTRTFNTGIAARGRIYIAGDNKVYAFSVPGPTPTPGPTASPTSTPTPAPTLTPTPTPSPTASPTPGPTPLNVSILLPVATVNTATTNFTAPVTASTISDADNLIGFQGDFTFDQTVVTFQSPPVSASGLTANNWNVSSNVLPGGGPIRTLRISAFSTDGITPLSGSGTLFILNLTRVSSTPSASTPLIWATSPNDFQLYNTDIDVRLPSNTPNGSITVTSGTVNISGNVSYCSNPSLNPVPGVTMTLTGSGSSSTLSDGSGNYAFAGLASGGSYTVTPTKTALTPGSANINTVDVLAVQRHFLLITPIPAGCRLTAADVNGDSAVTTVDVIAIQRFFLSFPTGIVNVGKYTFSPTNRSYPGLSGDQTAQNYDTLVLGDVASGFVHRE